MNNQWYIFPIVKQVMGKMVLLLRTLYIVIAATAIVEVLFLSTQAISPALACGVFSDFVLSLSLLILSLIFYWCHQVLLAGQGLLLSRMACTMVLIISFVNLVCNLFTMFTHAALLVRQAEAPFIIWGTLFFIITLNIGNMAAAGNKWKMLAMVILFLQLAVLITQGPELLLYNVLFKALLALTSYLPLTRLADIIPRITSMPE